MFVCTDKVIESLMRKDYIAQRKIFLDWVLLWDTEHQWTNFILVILCQNRPLCFISYTNMSNRSHCIYSFLFLKIIKFILSCSTSPPHSLHSLLLSCLNSLTLSFSLSLSLMIIHSAFLDMFRQIILDTHDIHVLQSFSGQLP